jgi:glycosyltransferase involved in cell wall biosynthesis
MNKVSIITLSYNKPHMVSETVESVLSQTLLEFEYIIVDNSTIKKDETRALLETYGDKDSRIKLFYEDPTDEERKAQYVGALYTNKYMDIAEGRYIYCLADDDLILPTCLQELYDYAEINNVHCCYLGQKWMVPDGCGGWKLWCQPQYNVIFGPDHLCMCTIGYSSALFRKDCLVEISKPYLPTDWGSATLCDGFFLDKLAKRFKIYPINRTLCIIRFSHGSNFSSLSRGQVIKS